MDLHLLKMTEVDGVAGSLEVCALAFHSLPTPSHPYCPALPFTFQHPAVLRGHSGGAWGTMSVLCARRVPCHLYYLSDPGPFLCPNPSNCVSTLVMLGGHSQWWSGGSVLGIKSGPPTHKDLPKLLNHLAPKILDKQIPLWTVSIHNFSFYIIF